MSATSFRTLSAVIALIASVSLATAAVVDRGPRLERIRGTLSEAERAVADEQFDRAAALYREVRDEAETLDLPNLPLARALDGLADLQQRAGALEQAAEHYGRSAELWESLLGPHQPRLAITLHNLGAVQFTRQRPDLAVPALERALGIWDAAYGADSAQSEATRRILDRARIAAAEAD